VPLLQRNPEVEEVENKREEKNTRLEEKGLSLFLYATWIRVREKMPNEGKCPHHSSAFHPSNNKK
jgi:hypothetical protein